MSDNQIPEELKCDHLFLLVGGNPLPNWVAARLLLRKDGQIYLAHSDETIKFAQKLSELLLEKGIGQPIYIEISDPSDADAIYTAIRPHVKKIRSGQIGLNYTGGTKAMSVHSYRTLEKEIQKGIPSPIFSYLDARTLEMRFDNTQSYFVGLNPEVKLTIDELAQLHNLKKRNQPKTEPTAVPVAEALVEVFRSKAGYDKWNKWIGILRKCDPDVHTFDEWKEPLTSVAEAIVQNIPLSTSITAFCQEENSPFKNWGQLKDFLQGKWLESYVTSLIQSKQVLMHVNDLAWGVETQGIHFEGDVIAIRGCQCHFISCYSAAKKDRCKLKLTEVFVRASQLGGDEARLALVCMSEAPQNIENEVASLFRAKDRIKVFGRRELENLDRLLIEWFNEQIPS